MSKVDRLARALCKYMDPMNSRGWNGVAWEKLDRRVQNVYRQVAECILQELSEEDRK